MKSCFLTKVGGGLGFRLFVLGLLLAASGCIIIPTPHFNSGAARENVTGKSAAEIRPGVTKLEDVLLTFGEPDAVSADERRLAFRSEKVVGIWIAGGGYSGGGGALTKDRYLLVELDEQGVVQQRELRSRWLFAATPDGLLTTKDWKAAGVEAHSAAALISGSAFWFPNTDGFKQLALGPGEYGRGYLALTENALQFRDRTQMGNSAPRWLIPYDTLTECRLAKYGFGRRVVIRTDAQIVHSFAYEKNKLNEAACQLIQARMAGRK